MIQSKHIIPLFIFLAISCQQNIDPTETDLENEFPKLLESNTTNHNTNEVSSVTYEYENDLLSKIITEHGSTWLDYSNDTLIGKTYQRKDLPNFHFRQYFNKDTLKTFSGINPHHLEPVEEFIFMPDDIVRVNGEYSYRMCKMEGGNLISEEIFDNESDENYGKMLNFFGEALNPLFRASGVFSMENRSFLTNFNSTVSYNGIDPNRNGPFWVDGVIGMHYEFELRDDFLPSRAVQYSLLDNGDTVKRQTIDFIYDK